MVEWIKKYWQVVVGVLLFVVGFLLGGGYMGRRANGHIERLRHDLDVLGRKLEQSKARVDQLAGDNRIARAEIAHAQAELGRARSAIDKLKDGHGSAERDIEGLYAIRDRLGALAEKYGTKSGTDQDGQ